MKIPVMFNLDVFICALSIISRNLYSRLTFRDSTVAICVLSFKNSQFH